MKPTPIKIDKNEKPIQPEHAVENIGDTGDAVGAAAPAVDAGSPAAAESPSVSEAASQPDEASPPVSQPDAETEITLQSVVVTALCESRWRIGRYFTRESVTIPAEELSEEHIQALQADSMLKVEYIEVEI
jgi:hypothetical protein